MKALKLFIATALMIVSTGAYAQFINSKASFSGDKNYENWSRLSASFLHSNLKSYIDDFKLRGAAIGWTGGFNVVKSVPLFVETGAALQIRTYSDDYYSIDYDNKYELSERLNLFSLNIPLNIVYKFDVNQDFSIEPMFGFDFRVNLAGYLRVRVNDGTQEVAEDFNIFDKGDMAKLNNYLYGIDYGEAAKRFQAGWHVGCNFTYKKVTLGVNYGQDFNEIVEEFRIATTNVSLSYNF